MKKISYQAYMNDLYTLWLRIGYNYKTFETFVKYAITTDRFDSDLGYSYKDVETQEKEN